MNGEHWELPGNASEQWRNTVSFYAIVAKTCTEGFIERLQAACSDDERWEVIVTLPALGQRLKEAMNGLAPAPRSFDEFFDELRRCRRR